MNLTTEELEKRKKTNKLILKWFLIITIISLIVTVVLMSKKNGEDGYHYKKGYIDRHGKFHKGGAVKDPIK
jgi:hypothetical protein